MSRDFPIAPTYDSVGGVTCRGPEVRREMKHCSGMASLSINLLYDIA